MSNAKTSEDVVTKKRGDVNQPYKRTKMSLRKREVNQKFVS